MDYLAYYGLREEPFRGEPQHGFLFESRTQSDARTRILRAVEHLRGLVVLVGGPGCGKSTLAAHLLATLEGQGRLALLIGIPHESCASGWLLPCIARCFGVRELARHPAQIVEQIYAQLVSLAERGVHPVLMIDEAQLLRQGSAMEELRALLNLTRRGQRMITLVLIGPPELDRVLRLDPAFAQRVEMRAHLEVMDPAEARRYIAHRLERAGGTGELFTAEALDALCARAEGVPRVLNALADNALFEGALAERNPVDREMVARAADDLGLRADAATPEGVTPVLEPAHPSTGAPPSGPVAEEGMAFVSGGLAASLFSSRPQPAPPPGPPVAERVPEPPVAAEPPPTTPRPSPAPPLASVSPRPPAPLRPPTPPPAETDEDDAALEALLSGSDSEEEEPSKPSLPRTAESDSADLDALFDEIQIGQ